MVVARKFADEEIVYAKWPGSGLYYKANVVSYLIDSKYEVKFESDDTVTTVNAKDIMREAQINSRRSTSKSPGRRSRSSSPSRRRRSRSPARKASRSPVARKPRSPARATKKVAERKKSPKVELERVPSEKSAVIEKAKKIMEELQNSDPSDVEEVKSSTEYQVASVTQSAGKSVTNQERTSITRRTTRSVTRALQQDETLSTTKSTCSTSKCTVKDKILCGLCCTGSLIGYTIAMVLPLLFCYGCILTCRSKKNCTFLKLPTIPSCHKFFNWKSTGYVFGWFLFQLGLSSLPLGKRVTGPTLPDGSKVTHILNGFASFVISMAAFGGLVYFKKFPIKYIATNLLSLCTAAFLFTILFSIVVFILSRRAGSKEPSGGALKDFVMGRIVSPRICPYVDLKMFSLKAGFISWCLLNMVYFVKDMEAGKLKTNTSLVLLQIFQLWYIFDGLFFEETLLYTASLSVEKMGFLASVGMFVWLPFFCVIQARYLVFHSIAFKWYCYVIPTILQVVGYYMYRTSTLQKFIFRKDPKKAKESGVRYISTSNGKNLLIDGWWRKLQHPNYTGDFMMNIAWAALCGFGHLLPWLWPISLFFILVAMLINDDKRCEKKHGSSWQEYKERVKYKFIPFVY